MADGQTAAAANIVRGMLHSTLSTLISARDILTKGGTPEQMQWATSVINNPDAMNFLRNGNGNRTIWGQLESLRNSSDEALAGLLEKSGWDPKTGVEGARQALGGLFSKGGKAMGFSNDVFDLALRGAGRLLGQHGGAGMEGDIDGWIKQLGGTGTSASSEGGQSGLGQDAGWGDVMTKLQKFADEMNMPIDEVLRRGDPYATATRDLAYNQASRSAYGRGVGEGGLSSLNADESTKRALVGLEMQRKQAGQQALGQIASLGESRAGRADAMTRFGAGLDLQLQGMNAQAARDAAAEEQGRNQSIMGMIGGGLGTIAGGYFGGASGAMQGGKLGSQFGAGLGGLFGGGYQPTQYRNPLSGGRRSYGLGGGGNY